MHREQIPSDFSTETLVKSVAFLEAELAKKDTVISEKVAVISEQGAELIKLSAELEAEKFKYAQLQRMIYGSKRERFISNDFPEQLKLALEPQAQEIEQTVKEELENIRISYLRKRVKKAHPGRLALPSHLPVIETIVEPREDTAGMVCIGQEVTDELDYTPAKLHVNRTIRPKYITPEDEQGNQQQVIAPLDRPISKCIASAALLSMIFTEKIIFHLPWYRIQQRISQMGVSVPSGTFEIGRAHV